MPDGITGITGIAIAPFTVFAYELRDGQADPGAPDDLSLVIDVSVSPPEGAYAGWAAFAGGEPEPAVVVVEQDRRNPLFQRIVILHPLGGSPRVREAPVAVEFVGWVDRPATPAPDATIDAQVEDRALALLAAGRGVAAAAT